MQRKLFAVSQQDLGDGQVVCQWSPRGSWLAAAGNKVRTAIGTRVAVETLSNLCLFFSSVNRELC